jgi:hypothetical protein
MTARQVHRAGITVLSLAMVVIGIALTVQAVGSDGVLSARLLLGVLFAAGGSARLYLQMRRDREA